MAVAATATTAASTEASDPVVVAQETEVSLLSAFKEAAATQRPLRIPTGVYVMSAAFDFPRHIEVFGDGPQHTVIRRAPSATGTAEKGSFARYERTAKDTKTNDLRYTKLYDDVPQTTLRDLTIDARRNGESDIGGDISALYLRGGSNYELRNLRILGGGPAVPAGKDTSFSDALTVGDNPRDGLVRGLCVRACRFEENNRHGAAVVNAIGVDFDDCWFRNNRGCGIDVEVHENPHQAQRAEDIHIRNCRLAFNGDHGISWGYRPIWRGSVRGCTIYDNGRCGVIVTDGPYEIAISDCFIFRNGHHGIHAANYCEGISILGNTLSYNGHRPFPEPSQQPFGFAEISLGPGIKRCIVSNNRGGPFLFTQFVLCPDPATTEPDKRCDEAITREREEMRGEITLASIRGKCKYGIASWGTAERPQDAASQNVIIGNSFVEYDRNYLVNENSVVVGNHGGP